MPIRWYLQVSASYTSSSDRVRGLAQGYPVVPEVPYVTHIP